MELLVSLGREAQKNDPPRAAGCLRQAADLARALNDPIGEGRVLVLLGSIEIQGGMLKEAEGDLRRALELVEGSSDPDAWELGASGRNKLGLLRLRQGRAEEAAACLRESLARIAAAVPEGRGLSLRAETLELLALSAAHRGRTTQALQAYEEALLLQRGMDDPAAVAKILNQIGNVRHRRGEFQEAASSYRQALEQHRRLNDVRATAATANNLASTLLRLGEMAEARTLLEECGRRFRETADHARAADVLSNLGLVAQAEGKLDEAESFHRESLDRWREIGDPAGEAHSLANLSYLALARGRCEDALALADESLALFQKTGFDGTLAPALVARGMALLEMERVDEAAGAAGEARAAAEGSQARDQLADVLILQARIDHERGDLDAALADALQSLGLAEQTGDPEMLATASRTLGSIRLARGEMDDAKQDLARAGRLLRGWDNSFERARVLFDEGVLLAQVGASETAAERLRRAEGSFERIGNRRWRIRALLHLARLLERPDPAQAGTLREAAQAAAMAAGIPDFEERIRARLMSGAEPEIGSAGRGKSRDGASSMAGLAVLITAVGRAVEAEAIDPDALQRAVERFFAEELGSASGGLSIHPRSEGRPPPPDLDRESDRASAPIRIRERIVGEVWARRTLPFTEGDRRCLHSVAGILALALRGDPRYTDSVLEAPEADPADARFELMVGSSRPMRQVYGLIAQAAPTDSNILLLGESGTGKELVARSIHARSRRAGGPFVPIACPSIPKDLIESELFGYEKGAFTGAIEARPGRIEQAEGGTLFLDEVGDISPSTQSKLLRFLQEREFERVGGRRPLRVDVRLIAATSRDLGTAMLRGEFREDLFYRLNVVPIRVPPLKERADDVPLLAAHFLRSLRPDGPPARLAAAALDALMAHDWPGNVRELRNVIEYMITVGSGNLLELRHLPPALRERLVKSKSEASAPEFRPGQTLESRLVELEADLIRLALEQESWNQSAAARRLGITESTIRNRIRRYGIRRRSAT